jgi:hypothetical protein
MLTQNLTSISKRPDSPTLTLQLKTEPHARLTVVCFCQSWGQPSWGVSTKVQLNDKKRLQLRKGELDRCFKVGSTWMPPMSACLRAYLTKISVLTFDHYSLQLALLSVIATSLVNQHDNITKCLSTSISIVLFGHTQQLLVVVKGHGPVDRSFVTHTHTHTTHIVT